MSILVLGIGNILLSDEGIGVRVVERLQQFYEFPESVDVMDGGTAGMELSTHLSRRENVILIDAVKTGDPAGTVVELYDEQVPNLFRTHISPHQLGISDVLGILSITDELPEHFTLYGAVPYSIDTSSHLSLGFAPVLDDIVARVVARLAELGQPLEKRREPLAVFDPTMMVV